MSSIDTQTRPVTRERRERVDERAALTIAARDQRPLNFSQVSCHSRPPGCSARPLIRIQPRSRGPMAFLWRPAPCALFPIHRAPERLGLLPEPRSCRSSLVPSRYAAGAWRRVLSYRKPSGRPIVPWPASDRGRRPAGAQFPYSQRLREPAQRRIRRTPKNRWPSKAPNRSRTSTGPTCATPR